MTKYKQSGHLKNEEEKPEKKEFPKGAVLGHKIEKSPKISEWRSMRPEIIEDKCIGCSTCVGHCPEACIEMTIRRTENEDRNRKLAKIDMDWCKGCGVCAAVCPVKAIIMHKER